MIKPEELRIGNWFLYKGEECLLDVADFAELYHDEDYFSIFEPISLTEEWLKKCGLEYSNKCGGHGILLAEGCERYLIYEVETKYIYLGNVYKNLLIMIKYVHQLQNLYFALTGKELIIKS